MGSTKLGLKISVGVLAVASVLWLTWLFAGNNFNVLLFATNLTLSGSATALINGFFLYNGIHEL